MTYCSTCQIELTEDNAYRKGNRLTSKCKKCFNKYLVDRTIVRKMEAIEQKGGGCQKCGYNKYHGALEFHHIDPTQKDMEWRKLRQCSEKKLQEELDKCILLCANCHRETHAGC